MRCRLSKLPRTDAQRTSWIRFGKDVASELVPDVESHERPGAAHKGRRYIFIETALESLVQSRPFLLGDAFLHGVDI